jgi:hypothetical protein
MVTTEPAMQLQNLPSCELAYRNSLIWGAYIRAMTTRTSYEPGPGDSEVSRGNSDRAVLREAAGTLDVARGNVILSEQ